MLTDITEAKQKIRTLVEDTGDNYYTFDTIQLSVEVENSLRTDAEFVVDMLKSVEKCRWLWEYQWLVNLYLDINDTIKSHPYVIWSIGKYDDSYKKSDMKTFEAYNNDIWKMFDDIYVTNHTGGNEELTPDCFRSDKRFVHTIFSHLQKEYSLPFSHLQQEYSLPKEVDDNPSITVKQMYLDAVHAAKDSAGALLELCSTLPVYLCEDKAFLKEITTVHGYNLNYVRPTTLRQDNELIEIALKNLGINKPEAIQHFIDIGPKFCGRKDKKNWDRFLIFTQDSISNLKHYVKCFEMFNADPISNKEAALYLLDLLGNFNASMFIEFLNINLKQDRNFILNLLQKPELAKEVYNNIDNNLKEDPQITKTFLLTQKSYQLQQAFTQIPETLKQDKEFILDLLQEQKFNLDTIYNSIDNNLKKDPFVKAVVDGNIDAIIEHKSDLLDLKYVHLKYTGLYGSALSHISHRYIREQLWKKEELKDVKIPFIQELVNQEYIRQLDIENLRCVMSSLEGNDVKGNDKLSLSNALNNCLGLCIENRGHIDLVKVLLSPEYKEFIDVAIPNPISTITSLEKINEFITKFSSNQATLGILTEAKSLITGHESYKLKQSNTQTPQAQVSDHSTVEDKKTQDILGDMNNAEEIHPEASSSSNGYLG